MRRPPADVLVYAGVTGLALALAFAVRERLPAPAAPPRLSPEEGRPLAARPRAAPGPVVSVDEAPAGPQSGTAFSVDPRGVWITAGHVVAGCARLALVEAPGRAAEARLAPGAPEGGDVAVLFTEGGAPALPLAPGEGLRIGQRGYHPGFPGGRPGEATSRLLGREELESAAPGRPRRGRRGRAEVLAWAEAGRSGGLKTRLAGLSGAPVLNARGEVVGVTLAEAPRRGRIFSAPLSAVRRALAAAGVSGAPGAEAAPISTAGYAARADVLRARLSVVRAVCLDGR